MKKRYAGGAFAVAVVGAVAMWGSRAAPVGSPVLPAVVSGTAASASHAPTLPGEAVAASAVASAVAHTVAGSVAAEAVAINSDFSRNLTAQALLGQSPALKARYDRFHKLFDEA